MVRMLFFGEGTEHKVSESINLCKQSTAKNNGDAMYFLGCAYEEGIDFEKSLEEAVGWFRKSAEIYCAKELAILQRICEAPHVSEPSFEEDTFYE
jgi:TPR repeat protein